MGNSLFPIQFEARALKLTTGAFFTCALLSNQTIRCWGENSAGQLGQGDTRKRGRPATQISQLLPPIDLGDAASFVNLYAGVTHVCALRVDGAAVCWGANHYARSGQAFDLDDAATSYIGDEPNEMGEQLPLLRLPELEGHADPIVELAPGAWHTCALAASGQVYCWGANFRGQLGQGDDSPAGWYPGAAAAPPPVPLSGPAQAITAGWSFTCALLVSGEVECWGANNQGQLGPQTMEALSESATPVQASLEAHALALEATRDGVCAIDEAGRVICWGGVTSANLNTQAIALAAGEAHVCALLVDGHIICWGNNSEGQLGLGDTNPRNGDPDEMGDPLPTVDLGGDPLLVELPAPVP